MIAAQDQTELEGSQDLSSDQADEGELEDQEENDNIPQEEQENGNISKTAAYSYSFDFPVLFLSTWLRIREYLFCRNR